MTFLTRRTKATRTANDQTSIISPCHANAIEWVLSPYCVGWLSPLRFASGSDPAPLGNNRKDWEGEDACESESVLEEGNEKR
jgi:hypothetical protein